ncbi:winged helix-turn-helix domain-containing protein [Chiayiivirga flava]|uniref:DNA-binding winged helix-turn-helix (WHTH) protein n=1 Tax=Chiayiivirga flava TaxID=659595 RepID=A0A7W8D6N4_9GAMM|nr:winged helix-turn-helix domain-containing protein [Chiayiivirga flava]MBB5207780.1 DNA-binding winged helix-turn-helix (wHTH) protein [Chiayiivirga flava]
MPAPIHRFGRFRLDPARRALTEDGTPLTLATSTFDVIAYLIANADRAVGRDELGAAVWGRTDVSDTVLGQTVLKARRALGDDGRQQAAILTVPRFGYRWVAPLEVEEANASSNEPALSAPAHAAAAQPPARDASADGDANVARPRNGDAEPAAIGTAPSPSMPLSDPHPMPAPAAGRTRPQARWPAAVALLALLAAIVAGVLATRREPPAAAGAGAPAADTAVVLPAQIDADATHQWLRLGVMDLVAGRLREGGVATLPSETVLGALARNRDALEPGRLAAHVLHARLVRGVDAWTVTLERSGGAALSIDASDADPIVAARRATDLLLVHLGRVPPPAVSAELEELLHRTRAAMLSDQLDLARDLLDAAPATLRGSPELVHRRAQLALREGDYVGVEAIVPPALAQLDDPGQRSLHARLLVTLAAAQLRQRKIALGREHYGAAVDLLADGSDPGTRGTALLGRGSADALAGELDAAVADLGRARNELHAANDALGLAQVDVNLAQIARMREHPHDALPMLRQARDRFRSIGAVEESVFATVSLAEVHAELLDHAQALATVDTLWPPDRHVSNARMRWTVVVLRARLLTLQGRFADAQPLVDAVLAQTDPLLDRQARARAASLALRLAAERGDRAPMDAAAVAARTMEAPIIDPCSYLAAQRLRFDALRAGGRAADAAADLAQLQVDTEEHQDLACMRIGVALALARQDPWPQARERYAAAMAEAEALGIPEALVEVAFEYVEALVRNGALDTAEAVSGRVSAWADADYRAAVVQAQVYGATGRVAPWQQAMEHAARLGGERVPVAELKNTVR